MKTKPPHGRLFLSVCLSAALVITGCSTPSTSVTENEDDSALMEKARQLAQDVIIVDGHIDLPYRLQEKMEDVSQRTESGDFDYVRAKEGGLDAPFMSIYIPSSYQETGGAKALADSLIDMVEYLVKQHPDKFARAITPEEVEQNFKQGKISLPMGMENGAPIESKLDNIAYFHDRGIRYITLTHGKDNFISDSSYDTTRTWNGLSPAGRDVVREMNRVGIMVDVAHISDSAFYQVMQISQSPVIASHSSCRHFTPGFERNMSDEMIKQLAAKGGVIQINFGSTFIDSTAQKQMEENRKHLDDRLQQQNLKPSDSAARAYSEKYFADHPVESDVAKVADHIDRVVKLVGIDYVGLGSDFDGVGPTLPKGLKDVSQYPNLIFHLLKRGYTEEDIRKICHENVFRVWRQAAQTAKKLQRTES